MNPSFNIRVADIEDAAAIAKVHNESFDYYIKEFGFKYSYPIVNEQDVLGWIHDREYEESKLFIVEKDGIVGYAHCVLVLERGDCEIPVMYFRSTGWGFGQARLGVIPSNRKQGLGSELVRYAIGYEWLHTTKYAVAHSYENNIGALCLFDRIGFQQHDIFMDNTFSKKRPLVNSSILASFDLTKTIPSSNVSIKVGIRKAVESDAEALADISKENIWWNPETWTSQWAKRFINGEFSHIVYVAEYEGTVVGVMNYIPDTGEIGFTGVHPKHQKKGIGTYFMRQLLSSMKQAGIKEAIASSGMTQVDAIRLYDRLGFEKRKQQALVKKIEG
ncbi:MAG: GNAT family N-acetyltransferase [Candidatus Thorarchaeota archaeon]|nr:GNAT family N-acetyltransferase [Candidatus Thorarchaeota archaeon]